jgi:HAD superfamily hydrolase (TIGR01484 family)
MGSTTLATDYDGTLAHAGRVDDATFAALVELRTAGRRLIVVSGRRLSDLRAAFPRLDAVADRVVAENGALLCDPADRATRLLCAPADERLVAALGERRVEPLSVGRAVVATLAPHEAAVRDVIRKLGLRLDVVHNRGAVMVLPAGVDKASGLAAALADLGVAPRDAVGVGDAENDAALLDLCGLGVAVAGAVPALKERADIVLHGDDGAGVRELVGSLLAGRLSAADRGGPS